MKIKTPFLVGLGIIVIGSLLTIYSVNVNNQKIDLRKQHVQFLKQSPFKETLKLSKKERKALGLTPNKYFERDFELTMNPATGLPETNKLFELQEYLSNTQSRALPGESVSNEWEERGPNDVGGRTRAIMFDPTDINNNRVFAGGVSGGLWVNNDITDVNSAWSLVNLPENLAVSCISYDPNTPTTFYVGTGESYVFGDVNGNGLWKSEDAGLTWEKVLGGLTANGEGAKVIVNSPGGIAGEYTAVQASFGSPLSQLTGDLVLVDDGSPRNPILGCNPLVNGGDVNGKIAVIERGNCSFDEKVKNAENAGAIGVIVVNNTSGAPSVMGGDDITIEISAVMISQTDGQAIIAELGSGVNVTVEPDVAPSTGNYSLGGLKHINDIAIRDVGSTSEIYVAAAASLYRDANPTGFIGTGFYGLYKSTDSGANWAKIVLPDNGNSDIAPNDIEIGADNKIWLSTTRSLVSPADPGGQILSSSDGSNFTIEHTIPNGRRTQIAVSSTDPDKIYALAQLTSGAALELLRTNDGFATAPTSLTQPQDDDTAQRLVDDFTGGQSFYNLMLEVDPNDDSKVYVGGIDLFGSNNSGVSWDQLSHWYGGFSHPYVHADQHAFVFHPTDSDKAVVGNDGGVFYASSISSRTFVDRNNNYNTLQFYKGAINQGVSTDKLLAGAQDNGTLFINNGTSGTNPSTTVNGGDGAFCFIDKNDEYMIVSYVYNNYEYLNFNTGANIYTIADDDQYGQFINPAALDSHNNILYADGSLENDPDLPDTFQIYRYSLGSGSATVTPLTNAMLSRPVTAFKCSKFTNTTLFVGTDDGRLFKITDANGVGNWDEITGTNFYGSISSVELGETEDDIYVTFYNYGVLSVFYSEDGGTSWSSKEGDLPNIPVRAVLANPLNYDEVIIGTDLGVWATANFNDSNPNWSQSQNGMKNVRVTSFDFRSADNTVLASTYGRGMFTGTFTADKSTLSNTTFEEDLIKVYPTVSDGNIVISRSRQVNNGHLNIYNLEGKNIYSSEVNFNYNSNKNVSLNVASGLYILKFTSEGKVSNFKIIIK